MVQDLGGHCLTYYHFSIGYNNHCVYHTIDGNGCLIALYLYGNVIVQYVNSVYEYATEKGREYRFGLFTYGGVDIFLERESTFQNVLGDCETHQ